MITPQFRAKLCDSPKDNTIVGGLSFKRFNVNVFLPAWLKTNFLNDSLKDNTMLGGLFFKRFSINVFLSAWLKTNFLLAMQSMKNIYELFASH